MTARSVSHSAEIHPVRAARRFLRRREGFTLVEVCMAMAVVVFALIPMMGVMALGISQVRSNIDHNQAVNIYQQVLLEARQMQYTSLTALAGSTGTGTYQRYFNEQGDAKASGSSDILYTATVTLSTSSALPGGDSSQPTLTTLTIQVRKTPGGQDTSTNPNVASFVSMISCNDLDYSGNTGI